MANYNLRLIDSQHKEAYDKCVLLLKTFRDEEQRLYKNRSSQIECDRIDKIIAIIQWIKYHLIGNDDSTIDIKCPNFKYLYWKYDDIRISPFVCNTLGIDVIENYVTYKFVVEAILDKIIPVKSTSIFAIEDNTQDSITLAYEINRIREKINV